MLSLQAPLQVSFVGCLQGFFFNYYYFAQCTEQPVNYKYCLFPDGDGSAHPLLLLLPPFAIIPFSHNLHAPLRLPLTAPPYLSQVHKHVLNAFLPSCLELMSEQSAELAVCNRNLSSMHIHIAVLQNMALGQRCCLRPERNSAVWF